MTYNLNQPISTQLLSQSAPLLQQNTNTVNSVFGIDHYPFTVGNAGLHQQVTNVAGIPHPAPSATQTVFYGTQDSTNLGLMQYSRRSSAPGVGAPTPVTTVQSVSTGGGISLSTSPTTLFDFSGIGLATFMVYIQQTGARVLNISNGSFTNNMGSPPVISTQLVTISPPTNPSISLVFSGTVLQMSASVSISNVYWTLQFLRINAIA